MLDQSMAVDSLRRCALFAHVAEDGLRAIAAQMRRLRASIGAAIYIFKLKLQSTRSIIPAPV